MKVSLILTTYNCKSNLIKTLHSIDEQDYDDIEVVIKDGVSTDGTIAIIEEYAQKHENVIWKSEPDSGIYDAMNQGFLLSTGELVAFFNDLFTTPHAVSRFVAAIENGGEHCIGAHADLVYATEKKVVRYWKMGQGKIKQGWMPGHPTLYLKREVYNKYGLYDTNYRCSADYEFMVRILKDERHELAYIQEVLVSMFYGGTSTQGISSYWLSIKEAYKALRKNKISQPLLIILKRFVRVMCQFNVRYERRTGGDQL